MTDKMLPVWEANAAKFALLDSGEGWPFAVLVACSVESGAGNGVKDGTACAIAQASDKTSAEKFAKKAGTGRDRVIRYLKAWDAAAADGHCEPSAKLTPEDADTIALPDAPWSVKDGGYYAASKSRVSDDTDRGKAIRREAEAAGVSVHKTDEVARNPLAMAAAIKADPKVAAAAAAALISTPEKAAKMVAEVLADPANTAAVLSDPDVNRIAAGHVAELEEAAAAERQAKLDAAGIKPYTPPKPAVLKSATAEHMADADSSLDKALDASDYDMAQQREAVLALCDSIIGKATLLKEKFQGGSQLTQEDIDLMTGGSSA